MMFATSNSRAFFCLTLWLATISSDLAQTAAVPATNDFAAAAGKFFLAARARFQQENTNAEAVWRFGSACFDWADFAPDNAQRAVIAAEGIAAIRELVAREPKLAAGHYYLAMNLGQLARTKMLGALKIVDEMEREFKITRELDEHFDFAGADRNLGSLYFEAPGWPASIGSHSKARKYFERAVEIAPGYPENHLNLLAAYREWKEIKGIQREQKAIKILWPQAKTNFTGLVWAANWADWEKRWAELKVVVKSPAK